MSEEQAGNNYIKCSKCKCKYINDEEHIKSDFGYNRLNVQYKCCVKCRNKQKCAYKEEPYKHDYFGRYHIPCDKCNVMVSKYQMSKHQASPICSAYAERAT